MYRTISQSQMFLCTRSCGDISDYATRHCCNLAKLVSKTVLTKNAHHGSSSHPTSLLRGRLGLLKQEPARRRPFYVVRPTSGCLPIARAARASRTWKVQNRVAIQFQHRQYRTILVEVDPVEKSRSYQQSQVLFCKRTL